MYLLQSADDQKLSGGFNVPICNCSCLLLSLIPHGRQHDENRLATGLEDTQQGTDGDQSSEVVASSVKGQNSTPQANVDTQVLANRDSLDNPIGRVFDCEDSDVNTGCQPGVLI
jgi:hypothetical protein